MNIKNHKRLIPLYLAVPVGIGLVLLLIAVLGSATATSSNPFGGDTEWAVGLGVFALICLISAISCMFINQPRAWWQKVLIWGPYGVIVITAAILLAALFFGTLFLIGVAIFN